MKYYLVTGGLLSVPEASNNEQYTVLKESKQSFYSMKNSLIINLKGKLQKPFYFFKMSDAPYLACSLVG